MSVITTKLSSKGQIVIPKEIRDELHWEAGTLLSLVATGSGVSLRSISAKSGRNLGDLIGSLKHDGAAIPLYTSFLNQSMLASIGKSQSAGTNDCF